MQAKDDRISEGTIMSSGCLRVSGEFLAMPYHKGDGMVVKLPRERVTEIVEAGHGQPFGPAGKVFKEWVLVVKADESLWSSLLAEGIAFVAP